MDDRIDLSSLILRSWASGWQAKEVMNIIYQKMGVRYHEVYVYHLLHKRGFSFMVPQKRSVNTASEEEKEALKRVKELLLEISEGLTVAVEGESISVHDVLVRRKMWTPEEVRPLITITGSHQKMCAFGTLAMYGRQLFARMVHLTSTRSLTTERSTLEIWQGRPVCGHGIAASVKEGT